VAAGPRLAAAVTNAGGIGVIGGIRQSPKMLQDSINQIKDYLEDKDAPFGVDLLIPQLGGNARKTNVTCHMCALTDATKISYVVRLFQRQPSRTNRRYNQKQSSTFCMCSRRSSKGYG
jgi:NAD(P)H-dependent flavin oxidoreductase YrpB (nitropropane dioxygenase family)